MEVDNILGIDEESVVNEDNSLITQSLLRPLAGVIAYVDVRVGANGSLNVGQGLNETLEELGASMATRLTKDVTHIIYKDGKCNLERINKREIFIVNPLWLDSCKRCNERVSEAKYPVIGDGGPGTPVMLGRLKRMKSLQPKPFEESVARSVERKKRQRFTKESLNKENCDDLFEFPSHDNDEIILLLNDSATNTAEGPSQRNDSPSITPVISKQTKQVIKTSSTKRMTNSLQNGHKSDKQAGGDNMASNGLTAKKAKIIEKKTNTGKTLNRIKKLEDKPSIDKTKWKNVSIVKKRTSFEKQNPSIVLSSISSSDKDVLLSIIEKLGGFELVHKVQDNTSHVICGANRRTVNVLSGTVKGCWVLSVDWIFKSLEAGQWLPEGAFELITEFPSAQFFRLEKQQAGLSYKPALFNGAGIIYVSPDTNPSHVELKRLLTLSGARITTSRRKADIIIGSVLSDNLDKVTLTETWIIDSITNHSMMPFRRYQLISHPSGSPEL